MSDDGGPAFPSRAPMVKMDPDTQRIATVRSAFDGMSLRDYFAAACMTGLLAADVGDDQWHTYEVMCRQAYGLADMMIETRKAKP